MDLKMRMQDNIIIFDIAGVIDVNSAVLVETVGQCIRDGYPDILFNFEDVTNVDYMGVSVLAIAYKDVVNNKGRLRFLHVPIFLKNLLGVVGLEREIEIFTDDNLAVRSFQEDKAIEDIKKMHLRRRFRRLPLAIKVEVHKKFTRNPVCYKVDMVNLSAIGGYIFGCDKFTLGDDVTLTFQLPPDQKELKLDAKVVWLCDRQVQPHLYPGMGVEFSNISTEIQEKIFEFVERNASLMNQEE
ncbi:MAG TPA: PilZ domain-containing protein [Candidatus Omnitrophota bacterium]|nr:PilZ domain-containing protein [Candidatus Omnitrophota bacterium]